MPVTRQFLVPEPGSRRSASLPPAEAPHEDFGRAAGALVSGYRLHGYRAAAIDPLAARSADVSRVAELDPRNYGLLLDDSVALPVELGGATRNVALSELLSSLRAIYCGSVALECALMGHPSVAEAAVIPVTHPKWDERPLAAVVLKPGATASPSDLRAFLAPQFPKFWLPDAFEFVDAIPRTSAGKFKKSALRERFKDYQLAE